MSSGNLALRSDKPSGTQQALSASGKESVEKERSTGPSRRAPTIATPSRCTHLAAASLRHSHCRSEARMTRSCPQASAKAGSFAGGFGSFAGEQIASRPDWTARRSSPSAWVREPNCGSARSSKSGAVGRRHRCVPRCLRRSCPLARAPCVLAGRSLVRATE